jgi:hypothetical protein
MGGTKAKLFAPLMASVVLFAPHHQARAQATASATVSVGIRIEPIAEIKFPDDFDFYIWVPDDHGKKDKKDKNKKDEDIEPVVLPFKIRGNAHASVTVIPDDFLKVYRGPWLGKARWVSSGGHDHDRDAHKNTKGKGHEEHGNGNGYGHDNDHDNGPTTLGYNAIVRFPVTSSNDLGVPNYSGFGTGIFGHRLSSLPGQNGVGTPTLTADVAGYQHGRAGLIFIVSERDWTTNGQKARPGKYRGMLEVTVTAED